MNPSAGRPPILSRDRFNIEMLSELVPIPQYSTSRTPFYTALLELFKGNDTAFIQSLTEAANVSYNSRSSGDDQLRIRKASHYLACVGLASSFQWKSVVQSLLETSLLAQADELAAEEVNGPDRASVRRRYTAPDGGHWDGIFNDAFGDWLESDPDFVIRERCSAELKGIIARYKAIRRGALKALDAGFLDGVFEPGHGGGPLESFFPAGKKDPDSLAALTSDYSLIVGTAAGGLTNYPRALSACLAAMGRHTERRLAATKNDRDAQVLKARLRLLRKLPEDMLTQKPNLTRRMRPMFDINKSAGPIRRWLFSHDDWQASRGPTHASLNENACNPERVYHFREFDLSTLRLLFCDLQTSEQDSLRLFSVAGAAREHAMGFAPHPATLAGAIAAKGSSKDEAAHPLLLAEKKDSEQLISLLLFWDVPINARADEKTLARIDLDKAVTLASPHYGRARDPRAVSACEDHGQSTQLPPPFFLFLDRMRKTKTLSAPSTEQLVADCISARVLLDMDARGLVECRLWMQRLPKPGQSAALYAHLVGLADRALTEAELNRQARHAGQNAAWAGPEDDIASPQGPVML